MTDDLDLGGLEAVETVAYRWRWPETMQWHYRCYNAHPDAETVEGLVRRTDYDALIARLRASEAATAKAVEREERAVELLADVHDHAGKMVAAFLDSDRREQLICADALNRQHPARFKFLLALPSTPPVAKEKL